MVGGSISPWVESIVLGVGLAHETTTADYQLPISHDYRVRTVDMDTLKGPVHNGQFNLIVSYSSIEHDGLGRYGDPLNPYGDFAAMQEFHRLLRKDCSGSKMSTQSLLVLNLPFGGTGILYFNQHRQYGRIRTIELIKQTGFKFVGYTVQDNPGDYVQFDTLGHGDNEWTLEEKVEHFWKDYCQHNEKTRGDNTLVLQPLC